MPRDRVPIIARPLAFVDVETTGFEAGHHEITEIAIKHGKMGWWHQKVKPQHIKRAAPRALEIQGYTEHGWSAAPPFKDELIYKEVVDRLENTILVGHNVHFDLSMIRGEFQNMGMKSDFLPHTVVCTMQLALTQLVPKGLASLSLDSVCAFLKIECDVSHRAAADVYRTEMVYNRLVPQQLELFTGA